MSDLVPEPAAPALRRRPAAHGAPRVGVILAAGRSERLREVTGGGSKALVRLGGLSLVERAVRSLHACGVERVVVVVGYQAGPVAAVVRRMELAHVQVVYADDWESGNGASLAAAADVVDDTFLLVTCDHLFGDGALRALAEAGEPAVLVDASPVPAAWAEGTRVRLREGRAVAFGKNLTDAGIDCGAFLLSPDVFRYQRLAAERGDGSLAGAATRLARARPLKVVRMPRGGWWQDVDTPSDLRSARRGLRRSLVKEADGPVSRYLNRPLSTRLSMLLAPLRIPPDALSFVAFAGAIIGALLLARGRGLAGGLAVQGASVLDGVDGEIARLHVRASAVGALLDGVLDRVGDAAILGALGLWALRSASPGPVVLLVAAAVAGALMSMATKDRIAALGLPRARERTLGWLLAGRDGRLLLVAVLAAAALPVAALIAVAVTSAAGVTGRVWSVRRTPAPRGSG